MAPANQSHPFRAACQLQEPAQFAQHRFVPGLDLAPEPTAVLGDDRRPVAVPSDLERVGEWGTRPARCGATDVLASVAAFDVADPYFQDSPPFCGRTSLPS